MAEFLPLCDVLFNVISLAGYFCDVVFDVVMGYALLERGYKGTFAAAISIVITSLLISQVISLRWYLHVWWDEQGGREADGGGGPGGGKARPPWAPLALHCLALGVVWRYARLLVPVELRQVKHQVRDLCMLRLVHAFCEAAPMLLLQVHVLVRHRQRLKPAPSELGDAQDASADEPAANAAFEELNVISALLSLFSVCWALASFSKNVRRRNVHRLLLTWLGVIAQFLWRLGTISARVCALTVYALVYEYWVFLVIGLHWVSMFLWLISPKNVFHGERISRARKAALSALIAYVYVFAYINLQELNPRQKMVTFYLVMCVENWLLLSALWVTGPPRAAPTAAAHSAAFLAGIGFMLLYYRYFHVRRLGYMLGGAGGGDGQQGTNSTTASAKPPAALHAAPQVPGVFNCRFANPVSGANARKKKKPTSFVPPPAAPGAGLPATPALAPALATAPAAAPNTAPAPAAAFWRRPLPTAHHHHGGSSENEGSSVGSRVNIQQKLQEKKQKQLAELRVIEEEIKQGKLAKTTPVAAEEIYSSLQRQPIPRAKTHADTPSWPNIDLTHSYQNYSVLSQLPHTCNIYPTYTEIKPEYSVQNFQNENRTSNDMNDPLSLPRLTYDQNRTFYENPANLRNEINRTPIRSPNYLITETRSYEVNGCGSPRNVLNNSPRNFNIEVPTNNYDITNTNNMDKPRIQNNTTLYSEDHREYSGYCENQNYNKYETKDSYVSPLTVQSIDSAMNIRPNYNEPCSQYKQNCERGFRFGSASNKMELMRKMQRCRTPEILLAPHYLDGCNRQVCCHWGPPYTNRKKEEAVGGSSGDESAASNEDTPRPPSDIDSQISLPRSYTLPREFRYWRRRPRHQHNHLPSNNSSDGDVDSGDNDSVCRSECSASSQVVGGVGAVAGVTGVTGVGVTGAGYDRRRRQPHRKPPHKPETKL